MVEGIFFFQAEDGIRDFYLSRGLGNVYKRQYVGRSVGAGLGLGFSRLGRSRSRCRSRPSVSYIHLTLPTTYSA